MLKVDSLFKLRYPINGLFGKILPKTKKFKSLHSYFLNVIDHEVLRLMNKNAELEINKLFNTKSNNATIIWDCKTSPVTYGDFIDFCIFARYLKSIGLKINFYITSDEYRNDWHKTYQSNDKRKIFLNELKELGEFILEEKCMQICNFSDVDFDSTKSYIPFSKEILSRSDYNVFKYAVVMTEILHTRYPSKDFLIKCPHGKNIIEEGDYIAWHIRGASINSTEEDELPEDIISYYENISLLTDLPIVVVSSKGALPFLKEVLKGKDNVILSKDRFDNFLSDAKIILASKVYIQCGWGGTFTLSVNSDLPYLGPPIERVHASWEKLKIHIKNQSKLKPWARKNQLSYDDMEDFKDKLSDILK
jgi:hypothetical protein